MRTVKLVKLIRLVILVSIVSPISHVSLFSQVSQKLHRRTCFSWVDDVQNRKLSSATLRCQSCFMSASADLHDFTFHSFDAGGDGDDRDCDHDTGGDAFVIFICFALTSRLGSLHWL